MQAHACVPLFLYFTAKNESKQVKKTQLLSCPPL
jgi:hypothetical protein